MISGDARHIEKANKVISMLDAAKRWAIFSHLKPDGDTLGCAAAFGHVGHRIGKEVVIFCQDAMPEKYSFILDGLDYRQIEKVPDDMRDPQTAIICVDTSTSDRCVEGIADLAKEREVISIDHHVDSDRFATINHVETDASSTGEVVTRLLSRAPWGIELPEAEALYVAIVTDNGQFSFASTSVKSHECAMMLLNAGVKPNVIADRLGSTLTEAALRLWAIIFNTIEVFADGRCAIMCVKKEDFSSTGATKDATDSLVNFLLRIKGVDLCALASERGEGTKMSIRSRAPYSAREVANRFGGGGHVLAAGCTIQSAPSDAIARIKAAMEEHVADIGDHLGLSDDR